MLAVGLCGAGACAAAPPEGGNWATASSDADPPGVRTLYRAEALQAAGPDAPPPLESAAWTPVALPDRWSRRWPAYDGTVWYRVRWEQPAPAATPIGIFLPRAAQATEVRLNGTLLATARAPRADRTWIDTQPRYWLADTPLLRPGTNTLLLRVEGAAAYGAGTEAIVVGDPAVLAPRWRGARTARHDQPVLGQSVALLTAGFFFALWTFRRRSNFYGWFAACAFFWWACDHDAVATSTWPFATVDTWMAARSACMLALAACLSILLLRLAERRWARAEGAVLVLAGLGMAALWLAPAPYLPTVRLGTLLLAGGIGIAALGLYIYHALRRGARGERLFAWALLPVVPTVAHGMLSVAGLVADDTYGLRPAVAAVLVAMPLALAWRMARSLRTAQDFRAVLQERVAAVEQASQTAAAALSRLAQDHARAAERLRLARDLHDGLGGTLQSGIAVLEHAPADAAVPQALTLLQQAQSELRRLTLSAARPGPAVPSDVPSEDLADAPRGPPAPGPGSATAP